MKDEEMDEKADLAALRQGYHLPGKPGKLLEFLV